VDDRTKKVVLFSKNGYAEKYDALLNRLIDEKVLLFCAVGKDCELWHDIMDELYVGFGDERDFLMITTWHNDENLEEVIEFAKNWNVEGIDNESVEIIEI
jgi:hypothetical protein